MNPEITSLAPEMQTPDFAGAIQSELAELIALRERLHRLPELGLNLPETQRVIAAELRSIGLQPILGTCLSSVSAVLHGGKPGPVVLLRADMDALPIRERTGLSFAATNGSMHACGHDLHMAGLIGAARILAANAAELRGSIIIMFQPGEEGHGGAQLMIDEGILELANRPVTAAYGLHVFPSGHRGTVALRPGAMMAGSSRVRIVIKGKGTHASTPELGSDPVPAIAQIVLGLQNLVTRCFSAHREIVISVTQLGAGESPNVIADESYCAASIRFTDPADEPKLRRLITAFVADIARANGCEGSVRWQEISAPVVNDPRLTTELIEKFTATIGRERVLVQEEPLMASEDFAAILSVVPGVFYFVSAREPEAEDGSLHVDDAVFAASAIEVQAITLATAAWHTRSMASLANATPSIGHGLSIRETQGATHD